jgi:hypothetical protein
MPEVMYRVAREYDVMTVKRPIDAEKRIATLRSENKCLGCERPLVKGERVSRGLCGTCYHGVLNAVRKKKASEATLIREGKLLPASPGGRKPANAFTRELLGK